MQEGSAALGFLLPTGAAARRQRSCPGSRCSPCCTEHSARRMGFQGGQQGPGAGITEGQRCWGPPGMSAPACAQGKG